MAMTDRSRQANRQGILSRIKGGLLTKLAESESLSLLWEDGLSAEVLVHASEISGKRGMCTFGNFVYTGSALIGKRRRYKIPKGTVLDQHVAFYHS
jgi:hypothetical protein